MSEPKGRSKAAIDQPASLTATGVFDPLWYRETYLVGSSWIDTPEAHFKAEGAWLGNRPNRFFDTPHYLDCFPTLRTSGLDPLTHYLRQGERIGAWPNKDFDPVWYAATYPSYRSNAWGAFAHFCAFGWRLRLATCFNQVDHVEQIACEMRADGLFDPHLYRRLNPDIAIAGLDPLRHYVEHGSHEGRQPHPLIDVEFYLNQIPSGCGAINNVLWHYVRFGSQLDINPNIWFDNAWYKRRYGPALRFSETPLAHFIRVGGFKTNPSLFFDAMRYRAAYGPMSSGIDPLSDFLLEGMDLGRPIFTVKDDAIERSRASTARMTCVKQACLGARPTALLVTFAAQGRIKGHVPRYVEAFRRHGIDVVLIVATPERTTVLPSNLIDLCNAVYLRENTGFDFAAWAHIIHERPDILQSPILYITNDSVVGPIDDESFRNMLLAIESNPNDITGLTDNRLHAWHLQSFFLAIKGRCLASNAFRCFWKEVVNRTSKEAVIFAYELAFTARLSAAGFSAQALFPMKSRDALEGNRPVLEWRKLAESGLPFVKASLLIGEQKATAEADVRAFLNHRGFETSCFDPGFEHTGPLVEIALN